MPSPTPPTDARPAGAISIEHWRGDDGEMREWMLFALKGEGNAHPPLLRVTEFADRMFQAAADATPPTDDLAELDALLATALADTAALGLQIGGTWRGIFGIGDKLAEAIAIVARMRGGAS